MIACKNYTGMVDQKKFALKRKEHWINTEREKANDK